MALAPGDRLDHFEIVSSLGAGNMGEVYRARDVRLGRDVAVKVILPALAADEAAVARFASEARAAAALNHPNIVALYDVGHHGGTAYVVTELLEGESLRERMRRGMLPLRKAVDYARQAAAGIAAAHDRGIVHRDLKPENLFVTPDGRVKILDFGIAQMTTRVPADEGVTLASSATQAGTVFGSVGYMAPEQARGAPVDHRADIFAIGCILYELVTGRRPFAGASAADTISALLNSDPPSLASVAGAPLDRVIRRCLEKVPDERFQSARDLAFALDVSHNEPGRADAGPTALRGPSWVLVGAAALVALVASLAALVLWRRAAAPSAPPTPLVRFGIAAAMTWSDAASISPDGRYVVYTGGTSSATLPGSTAQTPGGRPAALPPVSGRVWLRRMDALEAVPLSNTEAVVPIFFWSPDSQTLGYSAGNAIITRKLPDGAGEILVQMPSAPQGAAWSPAGELIVAAAEGIYRVPAATARPQLLLRSDPAREFWRGSPAFLPEGDRFLFSVLTSGAGEQAIETRVGTLDGRELGTVLKGVVGATYADGHLLFGSGGALYAQPFDRTTLAVTGDRILLAESVAQDWRTGRLAARVSDGGILVFRSASRAGSQFTLVDRYGRVVRTIATPDNYTNFSLSPDEQRIVVTRRDSLSGQLTLWLIDVTRGVTSLITDKRDTLDVDDPTWAPDGRHLAYRHGPKLVMRPANGGEEKTLVDAEGYPDSFNREGRYVIYGMPRGNVFEQWVVDLLTPGAKPVSIVSGVTLADEGRFSPNGRWIAYHSNETGMAQVNVVAFPPTGEKWQISQKGGVQPRWSSTGDELFYLDQDGRMTAVRMPGSDPRQAAAPEVLFPAGFTPSDALDQYTPMGEGFILRAPVSVGAEATAVQIVTNWKALIRH